MFDDEEWSNEDDWRRVVALVRQAFAPEASPIDVGSDRFDPFAVDATVLDLSRLSREAGLDAASRLRQLLKQHPTNWTVRIWVQPERLPDRICVWLEVDRFRVAEYLGKRVEEQFDTLEAFMEATWASSRSSARDGGSERDDVER